MKTGYFYQLKNPAIFDRAVCIARGMPKGVYVKHNVQMLAPSWALLKDFRDEKIDEAEYIKRYKEQLAKLNPAEVYEQITDMTGGLEPILMCHCSPKYFCHRHLVADWFEEKLGVDIKEYKNEHLERKDGRLREKCKKPESQQLMMF